MLENIHIVLNQTSHPGNIGAAARAMKTMGLSHLGLVNPKTFPHTDATSRASGADDLLANATVYTSMDEAVVDCRLVIGASARARSIACPVLNPRDCAERVCDESGQGRVALVFGNEQSGLSNEETDHCHYLVQIPTASAYGSLNLAAAIQVIAYEVFIAHLSDAIPGGFGEDDHVPVTAGELERFYTHLEETLIDLEFLDPENPRRLMRRLRRLFNRARPDENEMNILRGILSAAQQKRTENA